MRIETDRLIIRDLEKKDKEQIFKIVWQKESIDMYECKRYAVALKDSDLLIGTVGMGLEDTINEVEMAYFIDEEYQGKGYATEALKAL